MNMSSEMLGIVVTFVVLGSVLTVTGALMIDIELDDSLELKDNIVITSSTSTSAPNAYYAWCYNMKLDCG